MAAVTGQKSGSDQLEDLLHRGVSGPGAGSACGGEVVTATGGGNTESSTSGCESSSTDEIGTDVALIPRGTVPTSATAAATATVRRDWNDVVCFSCGKSGHAATRCPNLDESFPFMQPGWRAEKAPGGFIMIPPRVAMDRRRAENGG